MSEECWTTQSSGTRPVVEIKFPLLKSVTKEWLLSVMISYPFIIKRARVWFFREWIGSNPFWLKFWWCQRGVDKLRDGWPARETKWPMRLDDLKNRGTAWMMLEWSLVEVVNFYAKSFQIVTTLWLQICLTRFHALCMDWARRRVSEKWSVAYMTSEHSRRLSVYYYFSPPCLAIVPL